MKWKEEKREKNQDRWKNFFPKGNSGNHRYARHEFFMQSSSKIARCLRGEPSWGVKIREEDMTSLARGIEDKVEGNEEKHGNTDNERRPWRVDRYRHATSRGLACRLFFLFFPYLLLLPFDRFLSLLSLFLSLYHSLASRMNASRTALNIIQRDKEWKYAIELYCCSSGETGSFETEERG